MRFAYDIYAQTNFEQEDTIKKGLKYSKKSQEEQDRLFWHIINNKRMFASLLEIFPYYFAWVMAAVLLVNVSNPLNLAFVSNSAHNHILQRSYGKPVIASTIALIGAFEFGAKVYYGDPRVEPFLNAALALFPSNYTLGEALKVLRYGMPIILQGALLMMDNSFDSIENEPENPTQILENICTKQKEILKAGDATIKGFKTRSKDVNLAKIKSIYEKIIDFNKVELSAGIAESMDSDDQKKDNQSIFVKIFKGVMSVSLLLAGINYVLFGPAGFKIPKYQNMQSASGKK